MKHFEELEKFIADHSNWIELLQQIPYSLKRIQYVPFAPDWVTLMYSCKSDMSLPVVQQCRGTVVDRKSGKIICAPFVKFFNHNEPYAAVLSGKLIGTEKMDGWLIKMFKYNGQVYYATNGSLDVAHNADVFNELYKAVGDASWQKQLPEGWTLMFELISPATHIICDYNETKLFFIGARNAEGDEQDIYKIDWVPYSKPDKIEFASYDAALEYLDRHNQDNREGIVLVDENFNRVKMKFRSYIDKKIKSNTSDKQLFAFWVKNDTDDLMEFRDKFKEFSKMGAAIHKGAIHLYHFARILKKRVPNRAAYAKMVKFITTENMMGYGRETYPLFFKAYECNEQDYDKAVKNISTASYDKFILFYTKLLYNKFN